MTTNPEHTRFTFPAFKKLSNIYSLGVLICGLGLISLFAGDSIYGKVTTVRTATQMRFDYDSGFYNIRLIGVDVPRKATDSARLFVSRIILNKNARIRLEGRNKENNELLVRLYTDDSIMGIREVALELLKSGFALRQQNFDFKYGELAAAQSEAQRAKRGIWATQNN